MSRELVRKLLSESDFGYRTKIDSKKVFIHRNTPGIDAVDQSVVVEWELDFEARNWGVKNLGIFVRKVDASWTWSDSEEGNTRAEPTKLAWTPGSKDGWTVQVESQARMMPFAVYPREVSIYMPERKIVVEF